MRVFSDELIRKCIVDEQPEGSVEIMPGLYFTAANDEQRRQAEELAWDIALEGARLRLRGRE